MAKESVLNIIVCVKQVIDTGATLRLEGGKVNTEGLPRVMNPYDEYALEEAIRIRERDPATTVTAISLGPENFKDTLRKALAMGADKAVHLLAPAFTAPFFESIEINGDGVFETLRQAAKLVLKTLS